MVVHGGETIRSPTSAPDRRRSGNVSDDGSGVRVPANSTEYWVGPFGNPSAAETRPNCGRREQTFHRLSPRRLYPHVGPRNIRHRSVGMPAGEVVASREALAEILGDPHQDVRPDGAVVMTYVIDAFGRLRIANRRSEHVACSGGGPVRAAGELTATAGGQVNEGSNQSTG